MPISVDERDALRNLVTWARDELVNVGDPDNSLMSLQALTDQRLDQYQATVVAERIEVYALIDANPEAHDFWNDAQDQAWVRMLTALPESEFMMLALNDDDRIRALTRSLPVMVSMRWTLANFQAA